jgi:phage tail sheath gpL-like
MANGAGLAGLHKRNLRDSGARIRLRRLPFTDTASMSSWNTEYGFAATGRWNYARQQYGAIMNARRDTYANLLTWGLSQNSPVMSTMAVEADSPTPLWEWTASYCALAALGFSDDAARPLQTLEFYRHAAGPLAEPLLAGCSSTRSATAVSPFRPRRRAATR